MADASRLRALLTWLEDNPALFSSRVWIEVDREGGDVTDLGGRALILAGWTPIEDNAFRSADGTRELWRSEDIEREARESLGLTEDEFWDGDDLDTLFDLGYDDALNRLRDLTEQAEAAVANA